MICTPPTMIYTRATIDIMPLRHCPPQTLATTKAPL
jgi:hypothetical protein